MGVVGGGGGTPGGRSRASRALAFDLAVLLGLLALFVASLCVGSVGTSPAETLSILAAGPGDAATASQVVWQIRLPRALEALLLGGALSLSGLLLQTFFANPIADPFVLGVSSGAKLVVAVVMVAVLGAGQVMSPWASVGSALVGSLATMGLVLALSRRVRSQGTLIVAGVMVGYVCSAATNFLVAFADDQSIAIVAAVVAAGSLAVLALSKPLGAYQLGEPYAQSVGVDVRRLRMLIVLVSSVLSACVAAFAGPVSFVGIAAPHLARRGVGSSRPLLVTPACFLTGAVFCCGCDLVARTLFSPVELSVSAVTAVFGAPVVIALMLGRRSPR